MIIEELKKKLNHEANSYSFIIKNYIPTSLQSFVGILMYIASLSELSDTIKVNEIRTVVSKVLQYCNTPTMIDKIKVFIQCITVSEKYPIEAYNLIIKCFMEEEELISR